MTWLIIANVVAIVSLAATCLHSQARPDITIEGTGCSAFNYNNSCCLPDGRCRVNLCDGGQCSCSPDCHQLTDVNEVCCKDIHCLPSKKINNKCAILFNCIIINNYVAT